MRRHVPRLVLRFCSVSCRLALRLARRLAIASRFVSCRLVSRLAFAFRFVSSRLIRLVASGREAGRPLLSIISVILLYRPRHRPRPVSSRPVFRGVGRDGYLRAVPYRRAFSAVSFLYFVVAGVVVSLRGACGEIELTKTAHFNALVISVSSCSCSCSCCVAMGIGLGRTVVRQGTGAGLFGRSFCRICPQVVSANRFSRRLIPRPGGGGPFEAGG